MLIVVSPAKNLDVDSPAATSEFTQPEMLDDASRLVEKCRTLTPAELSSMMQISDKLASLNAARFSSWTRPFTPDNAKQAVLTFNGDVYAGLDAATFSEEDFSFAQAHLRILSGLYGVLRPLDLIQPYRLEMGRKLSMSGDNGETADLYQFWGNKITDKLNDAIQAQGDDVLINLASTEYFSSVRKKVLQAKVVEPVFKDYKNGKYKIISFFAKKARGMMARYIIQQRLTDVEQLKNFDLDGYQYSADESGGNKLVFLRRQQD